MSTDTEQLTAAGLLLALEKVRARWSRQGADFQAPPESSPGEVRQAFVFGGQTYQLTILANKALRVSELEDDEHRSVPPPRGLSFPRGLVRHRGRP